MNWFYNLSIKKKLSIIFGMIITGIILGIISGQFLFKKVKVGGTLYTGIDLKRNTIDNIARIRMNINLIRSFIYSGYLNYDDSIIENLKEIVDKTDTLFDKVSRYLSVDNSDGVTCYTCHNKNIIEPIKGAVSRASENWHSYKSIMFNEIVPALRDRKEERLRELIENSLDDSYFDIMEQTASPLKVLRNAYPSMVTDLKHESTVMQIIYGVTGIAGILVLVFITIVLSKIIIEPIEDVSSAFQKMVDGYFVESEIKVKGADEIGKMVSAFKQMKAKLKDMVSQIKIEVITLTDNSKTLSFTSEELANMSDRQMKKVEYMVSSTSELSNSIEEISQKTAEAVQASEEASEIAMSGMEVSSEAINNIKEILDMVNNTSLTIERLGNSTKEISKITTLIAEIAEQTNLLALNAAIEAARAGEQGKGFAVVADEVRKLAEKTAKATKDITAKINDILKDTEASLLQSKQSKEEVKKGLRAIDIIGKSLQSITESTEKTRNLIQLISTATDKQSVSAEKLIEAIKEVSEGAELMVKSSKSLGKISKNLNTLSAKIKSQVDWVVLKEEQAPNTYKLSSDNIEHFSQEQGVTETITV